MEGTAFSAQLEHTKMNARSIITLQYDVNIATVFAGQDTNIIVKLYIRTNMTAKLAGYGGKEWYMISVSIRGRKHYQIGCYETTIIGIIYYWVATSNKKNYANVEDKYTYTFYFQLLAISKNCRT